jgi:hypothetical protein
MPNQSNYAYNMARFGNKPASNAPDSAGINPNDALYQNAIKMANGDANIMKAITARMNQQLMGVSWGDEPLWNKTQEELDNLKMGRPEVYVDDPELNDPEASVVLPDTVPLAPAVTDVQEQVVKETPTPTEYTLDKDQMGMKAGEKITYDEKTPSVRVQLPSGEWQVLTATKFDKYGRPIFVPQHKGQTLQDEYASYSLNLMANKQWEAKKEFFKTRQDATYRAQAKAEQKELGGLAAYAKTTAQKMGDTKVEATDEQIDAELGKVAFANSMKMFGRSMLTGLQQSVGDFATIMERLIGTAVVLANPNINPNPEKDDKYVYSGMGVVNQKDTNVKKDITLDEAWQASRLLWDSFGSSTELMNEYIREYRANPLADPSEMEVAKENLWADLAGKVLIDPIALVGMGSKSKAVAQALDKTGSLNLDAKVLQEGMNIAETLKTGIKVETKIDDVADVAKAVETLPLQEAITEPWQMTKKNFYKTYNSQHTLLRDASDETRKLLETEGFRAGIGPNVAGITQWEDINPKSFDAVYATAKGKGVYAIPGKAVKNTPNGGQIRVGHKPLPSEFVIPNRDFEPMHEAIVRQALEQGKVVPDEVLADYPNLQKQFSKVAETFSDALPLEEKIAKATQNADVAKTELEDLRKLLAEKKAAKATLTGEELTKAESEIADLTRQAQNAAKRNYYNRKLGSKFATDLEYANTTQGKIDELAKVAKEAVGSADANASKIPLPKVNAGEDALKAFNTKFQTTEVVNAASKVKGVAQSMSRTRANKVATVGDAMKNVFRHVSIMMGGKDPKDLAVAMHALVNVVSDDPNKQVSALKYLLAHPDASTLLSQDGLQTGIMLRDMLDGNVMEGIGKILNTAKQHPDPLAYFVSAMEAKSTKMLNMLFPDTQERFRIAEKISGMLKDGKPIPKYLERYMVDGKPEEFSKTVKAFVNIHKKLQHDIYKGYGISDVNGLMTDWFIKYNPAQASRNAITDAVTMSIDGYSPLMDIKPLVSKYGGVGPAQMDVGLGISGIMQDEASVIHKFKSKITEAITGFGSKMEQARAQKVIMQAVDRAMHEQLPFMFKDIRQPLLDAGLTPGMVGRIERSIAENGVENGIRMAFDVKASRTVATVLDPETVKGLDDLHLTDKVNDILQNQPRERWEAKIKELLADYSDKAKHADAQGLLPDPESVDFDLVDDVVDTYADTGDLSGMNLITAKAHIRRNTVSGTLDSLTGLRQQLDKTLKDGLASGKVKPEARTLIDKIMAQLDGIAGTVRDGKGNIYETRHREWQALSDPLYKKIKETIDDAERRDLYMEIKNLREQHFTETYNMQMQFVDDALKGVLNDAKGLGSDVTSVIKAKLKAFTDKADEAKKLEDIDELAFHETGIMRTFGGDVISTPTPDNYITGQRILKESEPRVAEAFDKIITGLDNIYNATPEGITPEVMAAMEAWTGTVKRRYGTALAKSWEHADNVREFTLLDYRKKTAWDLAAAYVFPYQFWYSRSYKNWMKRVLDSPDIASRYIKYRQAQEKQNAGMPEWYRYQVNLGKLFGLSDDNPLIFSLEQLVNPLNGVLGVDFNDSRKLKDKFPAMIDQIGKFGPSPHVAISYGIATYYLAMGDKDTAEAWASRMVPITKPFRDITGAVGIKGLKSGTFLDKIVSPGGLELDPMVLANGGIDPYEKKKVARKLSEMVQRGELVNGKPINPEQAMEDVKNQSGELWDLAWDYMQNDPALPWYMRKSILQGVGGVFGLGLKGRTKEDILTDKFYEEYYMLRGIQNNLSPSEYKVKLTTLFERYPQGEFILIAGKNDVAREQAYNYNVLNRIPPGNLSEYTKAYGMDADLIDLFYSSKGRTDQWSESDKKRFDSFILDMAVTFKIPPTALKHEFDTARVRNTQLNEYLQKQYGEDILDRMNTIYDFVGDDAELQKNNYLVANPDVAQALEEKASNVVSDPLLNQYYGGIQTLQDYYEYQKRGQAVELFGSEIFNTLALYQYAKESKKDLVGFKNDHPEIEKYYTWNAEQQKIIKAKIAEWSKTLPETPQAIVNPEASAQSVGQRDLLDAMKENDVNADMETALAKYNTPAEQKDLTSEYSFAKYVDETAEKMFPGVVERWNLWKKYTATNPEEAARMWNSDPTISQYNVLLKGLQAQTEQAKLGNFVQGEAEMRALVQQSMSPELYRLAIDITMGADESPSVHKQLLKVAKSIGITYNQLMMYLLIP